MTDDSNKVNKMLDGEQVFKVSGFKEVIMRTKYIFDPNEFRIKGWQFTF